MTSLALFAAGQQETAQELRDRVTPGLGGFLVVFLLALATIVLLRSMTKHLRNVRYAPDPAAEKPAEPVEPAGPAAGTAARTATPKAPVRTESGEPDA